jgi:hypothetical protein
MTSIGALELYENEVLKRMYDKEIIGMNYFAVEKVAGIVKWDEIARNYRVKKSFNKVVRHLRNKGLVTDHGKSGAVVSLTQIGVLYVRGLLKRA